MSETTFRNMNQRHCFVKMSYFGEMYRNKRSKYRACITIIVFLGFSVGAKEGGVPGLILKSRFLFKILTSIQILHLFCGKREKLHNKRKTNDYFCRKMRNNSRLTCPSAPTPYYFHCNRTLSYQGNAPTKPSYAYCTEC